MYSNITCAALTTTNWTNGDGCSFTLNDNTVDVWKIHIPDNILLLNDLLTLLSPDELKRANSYQHQNHRERFIISRGALRTLLGMYLKMPPQQLLFETRLNKKPVIKNTGHTYLNYNVSHSAYYILIAFSVQPVGIDIECLEPLFPYTEILDHSFSKAEIAYIDQSDAPIETFYNLWTRKEALLKATGKGIDDEIKLIPCINGTHAVPNQVIGSNQNWFISSFQLNNNYACGLAAHTTHINFWGYI